LFRITKRFTFDPINRKQLTKEVMKPEPQKCKVMYNGREHTGVIVETRIDKVKVSIPGVTMIAQWYESNKVKRIWS
jgi:hypothetical protein